VDGLACRAADWMHWDDPATYDWVIGSDILYSESMHPHLRRVFDAAVAPGGRLLLADPFRRRASGCWRRWRRRGGRSR
jgi:predicted nicotinamide N-methyase